MLTIKTLESIKRGARFTLFNGIFSILLGIFYIGFFELILRANFRAINVVWQVFSKYNPRAIVSIGNNVSILNRYVLSIPFEYRKRWIHLSSSEDLVISNIEHCIFYSHFKHHLIQSNPLISIITPAYES